MNDHSQQPRRLASIASIGLFLIAVVLLARMGVFSSCGHPDHDINHAISQMESIRHALAEYCMENGIYPFPDPGNTVPTVLCQWMNRENSFKDIWGTPLLYHATTNSYLLSSAGRDQRHGTRDDITMSTGK